MTRQLAFVFPHEDGYDPDAFLHGHANAEALTWLQDPGAWPGLRLAIHGDGGTGKTHLLHLFAHRQHGSRLPGTTLRGLMPPPTGAVLAIDDADAVPDAEALLHLLNAAAERRMPVLLAGRAPPSRWPPALPDLDSRLRAITAVGLGRPDEVLLRALLARLVAERQLRVDEAVQAYLLTRLPRSCAAMREAAARLDRASLAAGRRVTRRLAAEILRQMQAETAAEFSPDDEILPAATQPSQADPCLL